MHDILCNILMFVKILLIVYAVIFIPMTYFLCAKIWKKLNEPTTYMLKSKEDYNDIQNQIINQIHKP